MLSKKSKLSLDISKSLYKAFLPVRWYMMLFAKFPFRVKRKPNGTYGYEFYKYSPQAIIFYINTVIHIAIFIFFSFGSIFAYFTIQHPESEYPRDRCDETWETTMFLRHFDVIIFSASSFGVSGFSGFFLWYYKDQFCHYFNFWSTMMQKVQFDCTKGTRKKIVGVSSVFFCLAVVITVLFFTGNLIPMEEASGFFIQALTFCTKQLYSEGAPMTVAKYNNMTDFCCDCQNCTRKSTDMFCTSSCFNVHNHPPKTFEGLKIFGFFVQLYGMLSTTAMFVCFEFYCRCIVNFSKCWNARLSNGVSADRTEDQKNELRRRLKLKPLMLDFGSLTEIFQMTEELFGVNLAIYYGMLMTNLLTQMYYFVLSGTQKTCSEWITENLNMNYQKKRDIICDNWDEMMLTTEGYSKVSFEDPCKTYASFRKQQTLLAFILFSFTMFMFLTTTWEGHQAVHQGLQGFLRLRKFNYMSAMTLVEKYFVHTLKLTYLGPCAIHISAAKYFVVRRKLAIIVMGTCFVYMMMMMGFGPGIIKPGGSCHIFDSESNSTAKFIYPKIV